MSTAAAAPETISSLEDYDDVLSWVNEVLDNGEDDSALGLTELDQRVTGLVASHDIACEDTSFQLERTQKMSMLCDIMRRTLQLLTVYLACQKWF